MTIVYAVLATLAGALSLVVSYGPLVRVFLIDRSPARSWIAAWTWALICTGIAIGVILILVSRHRTGGANACADRGDIWSRVGEHPVSTGKTIVFVSDYACIKARS